MTGREHRLRAGAAGLALGVGLGLLGGCTGAGQSIGYTDRGVPQGSFQLVAFDSCDQALTALRAAGKAAVGPYGFDGGRGEFVGERGEPAAAPPGPQNAGDSMSKGGGSSVGVAPPNYSGTNTHEAGVDEPDLVKTDGRRIVTISGGVLRVVDADGRYITGSLDLAGTRGGGDEALRYVAADLLLAGDAALVLMNQQYMIHDLPAMPPGAEGDVAVPREATAVPPADQRDRPILGPRLLLVDIAGTPRVVSSLRIDGALIDARQVGATIRVVVRSNPRLEFPQPNQATDAQRLSANREIIDRSELDAWLPRLEVTTAGSTSQPRIACEAVTRPAVYTGANLLTVLTFDLAAAGLERRGLGDGQPITLIADGDTVYSNGASLYVASDQRWRVIWRTQGGELAPTQERTEIYKFDTSQSGRPRFVAGGSVPGYLINQYAMSEWDGHLRVAATAGQPWAAPGERVSTQSGVYVLAESGKVLRMVGRVEGLGKGERIYAVRFSGPVGYVVTFRQVDPLYTVDLQNPRRPAVRGELKIPGYSAYLHPAGGSRLIGIGQNATGEGRMTGTQVSLFDVSDLTEPRRLANYTLSGANSEAEFDPHAFLYWPADGLLVVPLQLSYGVATVDPNPVPPPDGVAVPPRFAPSVGALVLRVDADTISEIGFLRHPVGSHGYSPQIRRSLMIGQTLWTVSEGGLMATDANSLTMLGWIAFF